MSRVVFYAKREGAWKWREVSRDQVKSALSREFGDDAGGHILDMLRGVQVMAGNVLYRAEREKGGRS